MIKKVEEIKTTMQDGKVEGLPNFPVDTIIPYVVIFYAVQAADSFEKTDKFLEFGFSFNRMKLLTPKQEKLLKPIEGGFHKEVSSSGKEALF
jgi:hypothetical protein